MVDPIVPDEGVCHGHNLPFVGGVGQDFLIPSHTRVKNEFAGGFSMTSKGYSLKTPPILQNKHGGSRLLHGVTPLVVTGRHA